MDPQQSGHRNSSPTPATGIDLIRRKLGVPVIVFIAPPAAGKSTQGDLLSAAAGLPHIDMGARIKEEITKQSAEGRLMERYVHAGSLAPDSVVSKFLRGILSQPQFQNGFCLNGYPRNLEQAKELEKILNDLGFPGPVVIHLEVSRAVSDQRNEQRAQDALAAGKPARADASKAKHQKRWEIFQRETLPASRHFQQRGRRILVNGEASVQEVDKRIWHTLEDFCRGLPDAGP